MENRSLFKKITGSREALLTFVLLVLGIFITVLNPTFFSPVNIGQIFRNNALTMIMALGMLCVMLTAGIDISITSTLAFAGMSIGMLTKYNIVNNTFLLFLIAMVIGCFCGMLNGLIISKGKVAPIICTMGTQFIFRGGAYLLTDGRYIRITGEPVYSFIGSGKILGIPFCLIVMAIIYVVIWYVLKYTTYGRQVFAVGGNPKVAQLAGIDTAKIRVISHILAAITAALGGIITVSQTAAAMAKHGAGNDMDGIAAVILGGSGVGGKGQVTGTLFGILLLSVLVNGMTLLNVQAYWQQVIKGMVLIFAVFVDSLRGNGLKA